MNAKKDNGATQLSLVAQKRLTLTGAQSVDAFSDREIVLSLPGGKLTVCGKNLKILGFSEKEGTFLCDGLVERIAFGEKKENFLRKVFR